MLKRSFTALVAAGALVAWAGTVEAQVKEIPWGTSAVGSSGHRALVSLADVLNRELEGYRVTAQPTPGAIVSVKGYATNQFEGYYGADIAFYELANDIARFEGFQEHIEREPVQSFWTFTVEVGVAIHARDQDRLTEWRDLSGERVFTGPLPWDVRAQLERAFATLGVEHEYVEIDLGTVGSLLEAGDIAAFIIYTNAEATTAPWITEASLQTDWVALNPSEEELEILREAGFGVAEVDPEAFGTEVGVDQVVLLPFYYGFHVGLEVPEDDVHRMLTVIEENAAELAEADAGFAQIRDDMAEMQRRGVESSIEFVEIHPGLAKYMREKGVWDEAWDDRVADAG
jgi:uncharacterized protein